MISFTASARTGPGNDRNTRSHHRRPRMSRAAAVCVRENPLKYSASASSASTQTIVAAALPEDMRGVFLLVAKAALAKAPCPSDEEIARAYGTRSPSRARRLLAYMEERGFLICASDLRGQRMIQLPDLGWQTAPGSATAAAAAE